VGLIEKTNSEVIDAANKLWERLERIKEITKALEVEVQLARSDYALMDDKYITHSEAVMLEIKRGMK
jgi:hypothetical protein